MTPPYEPAKAVNSATLQTLLVQEFRTCQRAFQLLLDEQQALLHAVHSTAGNAQELLDLASAIDSTLEKLEQIASTRLRLASRAQKSRKTELHLPGLLEGVQVLRGQISAIMRSNTALAGKALDQAQIMQSYLAQPLEQPCFPEVFVAVLDARHALETGDRRAMAGAMDVLQTLIARLGGLPPSAGETHTPGLAGMPQSAKASGLVEKIAALHYQQNAYRAVFQSGQRILNY